MGKQTITDSKLFKLKEWLTVPEAAKYLSLIFGEDVSEAEVLRLCLDGHLKLSVNFVNHAEAKRGGKFLNARGVGKKIQKNSFLGNCKILGS